MITSFDFIRLAYTPNLTQGGITYACRLLENFPKQDDHSSLESIRSLVAEVAVELAFRRCLASEQVPHDLMEARHFTEPDRYDILLGGRRCDLSVELISKRSFIRKIHRSPNLLLKTQAIVPVEDLSYEGASDEDLIIFSYVTGLVTHTPTEIKRAITEGQPLYFIYLLPEKWSHPPHWYSLGHLVAKSDLNYPIMLEFGGQNAGGSLQTEWVSLPPRQRVELDMELHSITYISSQSHITGRVGVYSSTLNDTYVLDPKRWENIWVYGMGIYMLGYITRGEFRRRAKRVSKNRYSLHYSTSDSSSNRLGLPVEDLHPLADLFVRAKNWSQTRAGIVK